MAALEKAESTVQGLRPLTQDLVVPEMRASKAEIRNINAWLDRLHSRLDGLQQIGTDGFEGMRRQLETYREVKL